MKTILFLRNSNGRSVENVTKKLNENIQNSHIYKEKYEGRGMIKRLISAIDAARNQGDVNHVTGHSHYLTYFMKKNKTILTIHDCEKLISKDYGFFKKKLYKFFWFTLPSFRCKYITTVSKSSKKEIMQMTNIPKNKIKVIYNGVNEKFIVKEPVLFLNDERKKILHIGSKKNKNFERVITALRDMNVLLIKIGKITTKQENLLKLNKIDYINLVEVNDEKLVDVYNSVDCLVFPSLVEGFGLPIIEAQACGCPVVTSNCSSMPEIAGEAAILVNPLSSDDIKKAIKNALNNKEIIELGFKNIKRFQWHKIAKNYEELYLSP